MRSDKKIFIIGMPGSGKSTIGKLLATSLKIAHFDLDDEIESERNKSVAEIFSSEGEDSFRSLENDIFQNIVAVDEPMVVSTGGGTPCFYNNIEKMNLRGITIYLKAPVDILVSRIKKNNKRPLLQNNLVESLEKLYSSRRNCYEQAAYVINITEADEDSIVNEIVEVLPL